MPTSTGLATWTRTLAAITLPFNQKKWWWPLFIDMVDVSLQNAFYLYKHLLPTAISALIYLDSSVRLFMYTVSGMHSGRMWECWSTEPSGQVVGEYLLRSVLTAWTICQCMSTSRSSAMSAKRRPILCARSAQAEVHQLAFIPRTAFCDTTQSSWTRITDDGLCCRIIKNVLCNSCNSCLSVTVTFSSWNIYDLLCLCLWAIFWLHFFPQSFKRDHILMNKNYH